jgi:cob(I)alamin adenosyltransferase
MAQSPWTYRRNAMTFKQLLRKLFAELWHRCARLAEEKISRSSYHDENHVEWWEAFITRCEKRALLHAEYVPKEEPSLEPQQRQSEGK